MRRLILLIVVFTFAAAPAAAQPLKLDFPGLAERATEVVDVTLDAQMLRLAAKFFSGGAGSEERAVRDIVQRLEGIYVRSYQFDHAGAYDRRIVENVRRQLGPTWKRIVNVSSRNRENVEVFTDVRGDAIIGLVVIAAEPRELTIVNIVGPIDIERLARLEGQFGVPHIRIEVKEKR
ncbi:MAG TPA: DUF4252 domain-containing protein [Thermoanaerobaculia bacterium]|nr:DUF4252 domain-containing protein [Thermoanaerobaculia bacterium]